MMPWRAVGLAGIDPPQDQPDGGCADASASAAPTGPMANTPGGGCSPAGRGRLHARARDACVPMRRTRCRTAAVREQLPVGYVRGPEGIIVGLADQGQLKAAERRWTGSACADAVPFDSDFSQCAEPSGQPISYCFRN